MVCIWRGKRVLITGASERALVLPAAEAFARRKAVIAARLPQRRSN